MNNTIRHLVPSFYDYGSGVVTLSEILVLIKKYDSSCNENLLRKAYYFAIEAHGAQIRASGEPYYNHPLEVAKLLAELHLDLATIITGLLHDVLEDTEVSFEQLEELFGLDIAKLVEGVTKLSKIDCTSPKMRQAESFRKFLFAVAADVRVLIVKLVDRLHNMRTLNYISSIEKRKRIALETLEIYAPLAERIGMSTIKEEIEDIAFYNLHPMEYQTIFSRIKGLKETNVNFVSKTVDQISYLLKNAGIESNITGREKKVYSIWKKMQKRNIPLEQINDIVAFRIIVDTVEKCYLVLGVIHTNYQIMPGRFKDYISVPKLNGYKSLHTTVIGPFNQKIEIQIKTKEMHKIADEGIAAHWSYKDGEVVNYSIKDKNWLLNLETIAKNSELPDDMMDHSKHAMYDNEIFCFTPKGDLLSLPRGATVVDFAYEVHTSVGNTCIGGRINNKMVPLRTVLRNGDQVDIITSPYQSPEAGWIKFVITGKAQSCIKKYIKAKEKTEFLLLGIQLTKYIFASVDEEFSEEKVPYKNFASSLNKFYQKFGKGLIPINKLKNIISDAPNKILLNDDVINIIDFSPGVAIHFADCCHPILGDSVIGVLTPNLGILVHSTSCDDMKNSSNFIRVKWNKEDDVDSSFIVKLRIVITNTPDSFAIITNIISANSASITNIKVEHRSIDFFDLLIDIKVIDNKHLGEVQASLRTSANVKSVRKL